MALRALLRLLHNEQVIQKIAESYPIKRVAQLTVSLFHKSKDIGMEKMEKFQHEAEKGGSRMSSFRDTFTKELKEGLEEMNKETKRKNNER